MKPRFDHLLIANRGEIAVRIARTARAHGYRVTTVYSEADADAPHVTAGDQAILIGPAAAQRSYLSIEAIIDAALKTGAGAIHPGYGFLSENGDFAERCEAVGLTFVGPSADAIRQMGDKAEAKRIAEAAGVPCVPGYRGAQDDAAFASAAQAVGYPVMVKAAAGGGGRGMRLAADANRLIDALKGARSEALNAFGSDVVILEKAIPRPRHIEVQVLADEHGNVIHLGERDCSVQRRHQKVIEEAPAPAMSADTRAELTRTSVALARAIGYRGAGTVEFIVDEADRGYFIEMNTRLQVEHPVTELVTGIDLVAQQLHIAQGLPLALAQNDIVFSGHAIEVRLYAENPAANFLPSTGPIRAWIPANGPGVRIDAGICAGQTINPHYDPMVAKIIAAGATREDARARLDRAIADTALLGPETNADFLRACVNHPTFAAGHATTAFIVDAFGDEPAPEAPPSPVIALAAALFDAADEAAARDGAPSFADELLGWSSGGSATRVIALEYAGTEHHVQIDRRPGGCRDVSVGDTRHTVELEDPVAIDGVRRRVIRHVAEHGARLHIDGATWRFSRSDPLAVAGAGGAGATDIRAPMHGAIVAVLVAEGDLVQPGDRLIVLEAMKMQHELKADVAGRVVRVGARPGQQVAANVLLIELKALAGDEA